MSLKYFTIILLILISNHSLSQTEECDLKKIERFCTYEWLPEFNDSILIIVDERKVNQRTKYCVLTKIKRRNYKLHCWTGNGGLETPTEWKDKLKIRFKQNHIFFKFGNKKTKYQVSKISQENYLLVRINEE